MRDELRKLLIGWREEDSPEERIDRLLDALDLSDTREEAHTIVRAWITWRNAEKFEVYC